MDSVSISGIRFNSLDRPVYEIPWKSVAYAALGVALLIFMEMTIYLPAFMPLSKYCLTYILAGSCCLIKALKVYRLSIGKVDYEHSLNVNESWLKEAWLQEASSYGYPPAMRDYARMTSDYNLLRRAAKCGDEEAKALLEDIDKTNKAIHKLKPVFEEIKSMTWVNLSEDEIVDAVSKKIKTAVSMPTESLKRYIAQEVATFDLDSKVKTRISDALNQN